MVARWNRDVAFDGGVGRLFSHGWLLPAALLTIDKLFSNC